MATLKEFEDALREQGQISALAILDTLRERDRGKRALAPARRVTGRKMTPEIAQRILELHRATSMTQQEIAFKLGVNQGRVNEVVKRGKWLTDNPAAPEAIARNQALERARKVTARKRSETAPSPKLRKANPAEGLQLKSIQPKNIQAKSTEPKNTEPVIAQAVVAGQTQLGFDGF